MRLESESSCKMIAESVHAKKKLATKTLFVVTPRHSIKLNESAVRVVANTLKQDQRVGTHRRLHKRSFLQRKSTSDSRFHVLQRRRSVDLQLLLHRPVEWHLSTYNPHLPSGYLGDASTGWSLVESSLRSSSTQGVTYNLPCASTPHAHRAF